MNKEKEIKVLIADDHAIFRDGLKSILENEPDIKVVGEAANGEEAILFVANNEVDVALVDINMPEMSGIEVTKYMTNNLAHIPVLILTMHYEEEFIVKLLEAGATGYVLKDSGKKDLIKAVKSVAAGEGYFSKDVSDTLARIIANGVKKKKTDTHGLTKRELEILKLIGTGYTNAQIGEMLFISHRTVDTHRQNLLQKTSNHNTAGLIKWASDKKLL